MKSLASFSSLRQSKRPHPQAGFTLLELLIAMALGALLILAAQRYMYGVVGDQVHLTAQQDQTTQTQIVLANIQNDLARAGFTPLASKNMDTPQIGVKVRPCTSSNCRGTELEINYWQLAHPDVYDCVGDKVLNRTGRWAQVSNIYRVNKSGQLVCNGNGGSRSSNTVLINDVAYHQWILDADQGQNRLLHLCLTTQNTAQQQTAGGSQATDCAGQTVDSATHRTVQMDFLMRPNRIGLSPEVTR